jgi:hypothetical protein
LVTRRSVARTAEGESGKRVAREEAKRSVEIRYSTPPTRNRFDLEAAPQPPTPHAADEAITAIPSVRPYFMHGPPTKRHPLHGFSALR